MSYWDQLTGWVGDNLSGTVNLGGGDTSASLQVGKPPIPWGWIAAAVIALVLVKG